MKKAFATISALLFAASISFAQEEESSDNFADQSFAAEENSSDETVPQYAETEENSTEENPSVESSTEQAAPKTEEAVPQYSDDPVPQYADNESDFATAEQPVPAKKDSRLSAGIKIAFNYGSIYGMDEEQDGLDGLPSGIGFEAGVMLKLRLVDNLSFTPEFNIAYIEVSHTYYDTDRIYNRTDLEIPLLLRSDFMDRFYVTLGPQINLNLSSEVNIEDSKKVIDFPEDIDQSTFEFGIAAGLGVRVVDKLFFDLRFYMGLSEMFPDVVYAFDDDADVDFTSRNWSLVDMTGTKMMKFRVGLSYWFF